MYLAIVLLPLLGAILGAASSRLPARARGFPAASRPTIMPRRSIGQSVHVSGDHAVIHHDAHEPGAHDDHQRRPSRPPLARA